MADKTFNPGEVLNAEDVNSFVQKDGSSPVIVDVSSSSTALRVTQRGSGAALRVEDSANPDSTPFVVDASGNVGIGTTDPDNKLSVTGGAVAQYTETANNSSFGFYAIKSRSGSIVSNGDSLGSVRFYGHDGAANQNAARIEAFVDGSPAAGDMPGRLVFFTTADGSSSLTERMRITSAGNVGIGTSSPGTKLDIFDTSSVIARVRGESTTQLQLLRYSNDTTSPSINIVKLRGTSASPSTVATGDVAGQILFQASDGTNTRTTSIFRSTVEGTVSTNSMPSRFEFFTVPDGSISATERMRIDNAGLITGSGTSLGAWTAYTPTLGGTGWDIGNGTATGAYCQIGKIVHWRASITFGSTSTYGAAARPTVTVPITMRSGTSGNTINGGRFLDASLSAEYRLDWSVANSTTVSLVYLGTNGARTSITATAPFTWATSDEIHLAGTYEAA